MDLKERIKDLCKKNNISMNLLEQELDFGKGYISKLGKSTPNIAKIQQIANHFDVSVDYLMTGKETVKERKNTLSSKEELDIAKKLDKILFDINNTDEKPLYYNGEKIDDKSLKVLEETLMSAMRTVELVKEKNKADKNKQS